MRPTIEVAVQQVAATGVALFGEDRRDVEEGYLGRENQIARPTREKEEFYIREYIVPKWGALRLNQIQPKAVEDWLHTTFDSWWTMHGVRAIMTRIFNYAEGHGLWEEGKRSPSSRAKLGKKRHKRERQILSFEETARVLARLEEPYRLIIEICIATGARISEVLGLQVEARESRRRPRSRSSSASGTRRSAARRARTADGYLGSAIWLIAFALRSAGPARTPRSSYSSKSARPESRCGTPACATRCIRPRRQRDATSKASGRTHSGARTSRGGSRSAVAPSKRRRLPATAIWR